MWLVRWRAHQPGAGQAETHGIEITVIVVIVVGDFCWIGWVTIVLLSVIFHWT